MVIVVPSIGVLPIWRCGKREERRAFDASAKRKHALTLFVGEVVGVKTQRTCIPLGYTGWAKARANSPRRTTRPASAPHTGRGPPSPPCCSPALNRAERSDRFLQRPTAAAIAESELCFRKGMGVERRAPLQPSSLQRAVSGRGPLGTSMRHALLLTTVFVASFTIFASSALGLPQLAAAASWAALFALFYDRLGASNRVSQRGSSAP